MGPDVFTQLIFSIVPGTVLVDGYITMKQNGMVIASRSL